MCEAAAGVLCLAWGSPCMAATRTPGVPLRPPRQSKQEHDLPGQAEKDRLVQPGEGKAEVGSCCCLQLPGGRVESRRSQAPWSTVSRFGPLITGNILIDWSESRGGHRTGQGRRA